MPSVPLRFDVYRGATLERSEELDQEIIKVGKLSSSHLRVDDPAVSRMHAVIEVTGEDEAHIIDLGSARGTLVNGERINKHLLRTGDRVQLGNAVVVVWVGAADIARAHAGEEAIPAAAAGGAAAPEAGAAHEAGEPPAEAPARPAKPKFEVGAVQFYYQQQQAAQDARLAAEGAALVIDDPTGGHVLEVVEMTGDTVHSVELYRPGESVFLGEGRRKGQVQYVVDTEPLGVARFPLVRSIGEQFGLTFTSTMSGQVQAPDEAARPLAAIAEAGEAIPSPDVSGGHQYMLPADSRARLHIGGATFLLHVVPAPKLAAYGTVQQLSRAEAGYMGLSLLGHALFLFLAFIVPPEIEGFRLDSFDASNRFVQFIVMPDRQEEPDVPDWFNEMKEREKKKKKKSAAKAKGKEGKAGKKDAKDKNKRMAIKGPADAKAIQIRREKIRAKVRNIGALAALSSGGMSSTLFGSDRTIGRDAINAMGGWTGATVGVSQGYGGFGAVGMGRGGGGVSENSIGVGTLGTLGRGGGKRKFGRGAARLGERASRVPKVIPGKASVTGALDKQIIRRVINKNRQGIKYCYDKELQKKKDLHGKIVVKFVIAPNGRVIKASIRESTMGSSKVEKCIVGRVKRFKFPAPKGGGIVEVSYPFIFKAS